MNKKTNGYSDILGRKKKKTQWRTCMIERRFVTRCFDSEACKFEV